MNIIDQDGHELIKMPRRLAQRMPEIFAVDAEGSGDGIAKEFTKSMTKKNLGGDCCP